ncbi:MAG: chemotaxis protein CheA [Myxococcaceae bacterium]|jgi:two-component system chemotaxis sensor kinase CheA|nr:chemotaxis protein CheA [Myxococcaceae bacterium]
MTIDLSRFNQSFFEECKEHVRVLEDRLIELDSGAVDQDLLGALFRAAHSIKGSSGLLGFDVITRLTHAMENVLDGLRNQALSPSPALTTLLLEATDMLSRLVALAQDNQPAPDVAPLCAKLDAASGSSGGHATPTPAPAPATGASSPGGPSTWHVTFQPQPEMFARGQDPALVLRELVDLGSEAEVKALLDGLPPLEALDPERCFLGWRVRLVTTAPEATIRDVFSFVDDVATVLLEREPDALPELPDTAESGAEARPAAQEARAEKKADQTLRVATEKVDKLVNLVGELVIAQAMISRSLVDFEPSKLHTLVQAVGDLERHTRELQDQVMNIRMVPIGTIFGRFRRLVRDLSGSLGKDVRLELVGEDTELDKSMVEHLADPLMHLVRNAADHGLETTEERLAAGKTAHGTITLAARHQGGNVVVDVSDDGKGLDTARILAKAIERGLAAPGVELPPERVHEFIFAAGFSTAQAVTDLSGRGVGMDVVKRSVDGLNGTIAITTTPGQGTRFRITLPLTLAIIDGMSLRVGGATFVLPLNQVVETLPLSTAPVRSVFGHGEVVLVRGDPMPMVRLSRVLSVDDDPEGAGRPLAVVLETGDVRFALRVDELLGKAQFVIKSLEPNLTRPDGVLGATIMGDGTVALILDVPGLARLGDVRARADDGRSPLSSRAPQEVYA